MYVCRYFYHSFYLPYYCNITYVVLSFDEIKTHYYSLLLLLLLLLLFSQARSNRHSCMRN